MYINISRYTGAAGKISEAAPKVQQGFVALLKNQPGFLGYAAFASEQGDIVALHLWENADALANSREKIRSWVSANMPEFAEPSERFNGTIGPHGIAASQSGGPGQSLYCMVRKSENLPGPETQVPAVREMVSATRKAPGFRGAYVARSADDPTRGASVTFFDNREHAQAAHEAALAVMHKHQPDVVVRVAGSGQTAVLTMAQ
jgi:heme-degrading monooxygenase HmoA